MSTIAHLCDYQMGISAVLTPSLRLFQWTTLGGHQRREEQLAFYNQLDSVLNQFQVRL
jgi:hypothetical protein